MKKYLVIWRGHEAEFQQSCVELPEDTDPTSLSNSEWVIRGALAEGYGENDAIDLVSDSYDFLLATDMPGNFYGND